MPHETGDIFPVFDPVTEEFLCHKPRELVHTEGDWHRGVQANIIRPNDKGTFDVLLQERSGVVDIGRHKYDQSLATQMLAADVLDRDSALDRGLLCELGVTDYSAHRLPLSLRIVKTYPEHPGTLNRELIDLYIVRVPKEQITAITPKVKRLKWMEWSELLAFFSAHPHRFTKTGQFYFSDETLLPLIETSSYAFLYGAPQQTHTTPAILRVDRWPKQPRTYRGELGKILAESGEVSI